MFTSKVDAAGVAGRTVAVDRAAADTPVVDRAAVGGLVGRTVAGGIHRELVDTLAVDRVGSQRVLLLLLLCRRADCLRGWELVRSLG